MIGTILYYIYWSQCFWMCKHTHVHDTRFITSVGLFFFIPSFILCSATDHHEDRDYANKTNELFRWRKSGSPKDSWEACHELRGAVSVLYNLVQNCGEKQTRALYRRPISLKLCALITIRFIWKLYVGLVTMLAN